VEERRQLRVRRERHYEHERLVGLDRRVAAGSDCEGAQFWVQARKGVALTGVKRGPGEAEEA
jgi:hypothetical protein